MSNKRFPKTARAPDCLTISAPDHDPAKRSLLFPNPVIEFSFARVDRAAIRKGLEMTPEERLKMSQRESDRD
jgi:hypothetical protein